MADVQASDIVTALNTAWDDKVYAKPVTGIGAGFVSGVGNIFWNTIRRTDTWKGLYTTLKQTFIIKLRHPTEAAINYCMGLINALTLASTIRIIPSPQIGRGPNGEFDCIFEVEFIQ